MLSGPGALLALVEPIATSDTVVVQEVQLVLKEIECMAVTIDSMPRLINVLAQPFTASFSVPLAYGVKLCFSLRGNEYIV